MVNNIKLRLRSGNFEIEVEGAHGDVVSILEKYWAPGAPLPTQVGDTAGATPKPKQRVKRVVPIAHGEDDDSDSSFDAHKLATGMKQDDNFQLFVAKVLHERDQWNKIALVLWFADTPLTSGQVQKVLGSLNVRMKLQNVTKVMRREHSKLISDKPRTAGARVPYRLESRAESAFEKWLLSDEQ